MNEAPRCWCGNTALISFSPAYVRCLACETLVSAQMPAPDFLHVVNDERDFYGREYWFSHQEKDLGFPNILTRSRVDLFERCLHWLRTALKYKLPPGRALEIGCAHGGFVALLRWAGFDAIGLELSPWVVKFAQETFGVPMLLGQIEIQSLEPASLDMIAMMDVLEHLPDPVSTMQHCLALLKQDGVLVIQTPQYVEGKTYEEITFRNDPFLEVLKEQEHLYLFSQRAIDELFCRLGVPHVAYERAIFAQYDMFLVVSRSPLLECNTADSEKVLATASSGRLVQGLLDLDQQLRTSKEHSAELEADRAARLRVIEEQGQRLGGVEAERNELRAQLADVQQQFAAAEADRAARLQMIEQQGVEVMRLQREVHEWLEKNAQLQQQLEEVMKVSSSYRELAEAQERQIEMLTARLQATEQVLRFIKSGRIYKLLRRFGRWGWIEERLRSQEGSNLSRIALPIPQEVARETKEIPDDNLVAQSLAAYRNTIDAFNASQPNRKLLEDIRSYSHFMVNELNFISPLQGKLILDIGASPHGYALERTLDHGAALYVGIGLDIPSTQYIRGEHGNVGLLLNMDVTLLQFPTGLFDAVISISTFEHLTDVEQALSEIARVLGPEGVALLSFEPVWSCSYGHHLHHFGECAKLIPPWAHLIWTPEQMQESLSSKWPHDAPLSLSQAIEWVYQGNAINRVDIRRFKHLFEKGPLKVESLVALREESIDQTALQTASAVSGLSAEELTTKGLSLVLRKEAKGKTMASHAPLSPQDKQLATQKSTESEHLVHFLERAIFAAGVFAFQSRL